MDRAVRFHAQWQSRSAINKRLLRVRGIFRGAREVLCTTSFAVAIVLIGLLSIAFRLEKATSRYASITLAIIILIPRAGVPHD